MRGILPEDICWVRARPILAAARYCQKNIRLRRRIRVRNGTDHDGVLTDCFALLCICPVVLAFSVFINPENLMMTSYFKRV